MPRPEPRPKFGSSRALQVMAIAAELSSSGMKYSTARKAAVALLAGEEDAEQDAHRGLDQPGEDHDLEGHAERVEQPGVGEDRPPGVSPTGLDGADAVPAG